MMTKQEEIREAIEQEKERIIALINLWRPHNNLGTSISVGRLIRLAIRGQQATSPLDKEFLEMLAEERRSVITATDDETDSQRARMSKEIKPEDKLWGIGDRKWFERQIKTFGLDVAKEHLQGEIDKKADLKQNNPKEYSRIYRGT